MNGQRCFIRSHDDSLNFKAPLIPDLKKIINVNAYHFFKQITGEENENTRRRIHTIKKKTAFMTERHFPSQSTGLYKKPSKTLSLLF